GLLRIGDAEIGVEGELDGFRLIGLVSQAEVHLKTQFGAPERQLQLQALVDQAGTDLVTLHDLPLGGARPTVLGLLAQQRAAPRCNKRDATTDGISLTKFTSRAEEQDVPGVEINRG